MTNYQSCERMKLWYILSLIICLEGLRKMMCAFCTRTVCSQVVIDKWDIQNIFTYFKASNFEEHSEF